MAIVRMASPIGVYVNESLASSPHGLPSLDGKVVGFLRNWPPAAVNILKALGTLLEQRHVAGVLAVGLTVLGAGAARGQEYPNRPVRIIAGSPGGGVDFAARLIAQELAGSLGRQVIVENRGSGGGAIAAQTVVRAPPDGYTLLFYGSPIWLAPFLRDNVDYDPMRDFSPITLAVSQPNILVVHPSLPVKSVRELIALAKARPGALNYTSGSAGSSSHLAGELLKAMAGVDIVRINYVGTGPALNALISGEMQMMFVPTGAAGQHVKSGRLRALAVTSAQPSALAPDLPTMAASGLPGYDSVATYGAFAPAKTPAPLINRLNQEFVRVLQTPQVKDRFFRSGVETVGSSPQEFAAVVKSEMTNMGKLIKAVGIRGD
ncbi:MAG: tripartite tricarboxylate transporter substrate binding protein [Betaproteobacteria bacterium]|nr:tripartite tricarboxylate transporter substrate binding protein [Betaproteobacteria bacterium]